MKQSCSGSSARPNTSSQLQQFTQHLWTQAAIYIYIFLGGGVWLHCSPWTFTGRVRIGYVVRGGRRSVRWEGAEARRSSEAAASSLLRYSGCDSGHGLQREIEIKWDILLLLLCLSQSICRWQYSTAIYHRDPLILTNLIKETHWQPFYLRDSQ